MSPEEKREELLFLAGMAMQLFSYSNDDWYDRKDIAAKGCAESAVLFAKALLAEIDKECAD